MLQKKKMAKVYITSGTSWAGVATDGSNITVECIGGGGGSSSAGSVSSGGGGGGAYSKVTVAYSSCAAVNGIQIGQGGNSDNGTDTIWNTNVAIAKAGLRQNTAVMEKEKNQKTNQLNFCKRQTKNSKLS